MANKADTEIEEPTENDDVCCGLILRQIEYEWNSCPFCGEDLPDWAIFSNVVVAKGAE
jgi:3-deoxy-D-manno-octulosonate 8-phosphate phosphatase KdsC-like HAD superfamily phosphatase